MSDKKKIKHKITTRHSGGETPERIYRSLIRQAVLMTLQSEEVDELCVVNVLITNDEGIQKYNLEFRNIDHATDVLSFPMQTFKRPGWRGISSAELDEDTKELPLGDIIISTESIKNQAIEYENTIEYETTYMLIHSTLHLLGYDHDTESSERTMHNKKKLIMREMGYME